MKAKYILFYKDLIQPGGAERLLFEVYRNLRLLGFEAKIVTYRFNNLSSFGFNIPEDDIYVVPGKSKLSKIVSLSRYIYKHRQANFICDSGHIDFYLGSLLSKISYSMHIHHPSFMTFNETDKYSIFASDSFKKLSESNYGAEEFIEEKESLSFHQKIKINLKALISILSIKKAKHVFVLSEYAAVEKKLIYGISTHVLIPGLDESYFNHKITNKFSLQNYSKVLLTLCRIDETKRLKELIEAFKIYSEVEKNSLLLIAGDGPYRDELEEYTLALNLNVKFLGFIEEDSLLDLYASADLFVSIDRADFRITALEANVVGTKTLLSNETEPLAELMQSGFLQTCKPNPESTAKAIGEFINVEPKISLEELHIILKQFTWHNYTKDMVEIIESKI